MEKGWRKVETHEAKWAVISHGFWRSEEWVMITPRFWIGQPEANPELRNTEDLRCRMMHSFETLCLRCQAAPHRIMSFLYMKHSLILTEAWSTPVMQVSSPLPPCKLHLEKLLATYSGLSSLSRRHTHTALRKRKFFTLQIWSCYSYPTSRSGWSSNTLAWLPGFCDNLVSHILCFYLKYHLCPTVTPSKLLYPAGLSLSVSFIWTFPIPSHSPKADLDLCSRDQTSVGKAHFKADRTLVYDCYSFIASEHSSPWGAGLCGLHFPISCLGAKLCLWMVLRHAARL